MYFLDNAILVILSILLILASVFVVAYSLGGDRFISMDTLIDIAELIKGNYTYAIIGLAILLLSIRMLIVGLKINRNTAKTTYLVQRTDHGEVCISSETIIGLVENVSNKFTSVKNIITKVNILEGQVFIDLKGEVNPETNIPETIKDLQNKIKEHVENSTGATVGEIKVVISRVTKTMRNVKWLWGVCNCLGNWWRN